MMTWDVEGHHGCFETHQATLGGKHLINNMIRDVEMHNKGIKKDIEHVKNNVAPNLCPYLNNNCRFKKMF